MNNTPRDEGLLGAVLASDAVLLFIGWCWWETRNPSWHERPWWYAVPTAAAAFLIGGVLGWLWPCWFAGTAARSVIAAAKSVIAEDSTSSAWPTPPPAGQRSRTIASQCFDLLSLRRMR